MKNLAFIVLLIGIFTSCNKSEDESNYPIAFVSLDDYKNIIKEVESDRPKRLIDLNTFIKFSNEENTIILDSRSKLRYDRKHLKNAIHLEFTEFTQKNLKKIIPDSTTKILIYCNNNFEGDQIDFASKTFVPSLKTDSELSQIKKQIMLALNIPTYINLYGYGYKNVYELHELVNVKDPRIEFKGTNTNVNKNLQTLNMN